VLAPVVIDRTYSRQFLPKSSSPRTLCLSVEFSDSLRPTSVVPTTYAHHSQRPFLNPFAINPLRTLFISTGVMPAMALPHDSDPLDCLFFSPYLLYFQYLENHFALFCTPQKINSFIFKRFRTLCKKKTGVGGVGISAIRKFLEIQHGQSGQLSPLHDTPVTSQQTPTRVSQVQPKMEGLSLCMSTFDLVSLAESAELELAMVFVLGRLVRPHHGLR